MATLEANHINSSHLLITNMAHGLSLLTLGTLVAVFIQQLVTLCTTHAELHVFFTHLIDELELRHLDDPGNCLKHFQTFQEFEVPLVDVEDAGVCEYVGYLFA